MNKIKEKDITDIYLKIKRLFNISDEEFKQAIKNNLSNNSESIWSSGPLFCGSKDLEEHSPKHSKKG